MKRRPLVASLLAMVPALLLMLIPAATQSGVSDFWKGFMLGSGGVIIIAVAVLTILLARSSDKGK